MKYKISDDIFYRKYGNSTVVFKIQKRQLFVMNDICFDVFNYFKNFREYEGLIGYLEKKYQKMANKAQANGIKSFFDSLLNIEILKQEFKPFDEKYGLESVIQHSNILPKNTFFSAMFELTYRCNEKCRHCYCVNPDANKELTTKKIKSLIDELKDLNVLELTFTGGDLFIRKDAFEILDYAYSKNMMINIFTNGTLLKDEDFYHLKKLNLKSISFSLYSHLSKKHDYFTQLPGSFVKTTNAIKKCVALGIPVNIKTSVVDYNLDDLEGIIKLDLSLGGYPQISMAITPKNDGDMSSTKLRINNSNKYYKAFLISESFIEEEQKKEYQEIIKKEDKICWAGSNGISINPYGEVYACNALLIKCGDVRKQTIKDIWDNSKELKTIRLFNMGMIKGCENAKLKSFVVFVLEVHIVNIKIR